jgi:hypothetical protein
MHRIVLLAAAAALIALPASAQSIRISTVGKSPAQVRNEVYKAAYKLCAANAYGSTIWIDEMRACADGTTRATLAQRDAPNPKFAQR